LGRGGRGHKAQLGRKNQLVQEENYRPLYGRAYEELGRIASNLFHEQGGTKNGEQKGERMKVEKRGDDEAERNSAYKSRNLEIENQSKRERGENKNSKMHDSPSLEPFSGNR